MMSKQLHNRGLFCRDPHGYDTCVVSSYDDAVCRVLTEHAQTTHIGGYIGYHCSCCTVQIIKITVLGLMKVLVLDRKTNCLPMQPRENDMVKTQVVSHDVAVLSSGFQDLDYRKSKLRQVQQLLSASPGVKI